MQLSSNYVKKYLRRIVGVLITVNRGKRESREMVVKPSKHQGNKQRCQDLCSCNHSHQLLCSSSIKPSSAHKPHNKVNRVTREYVKKQIKRKLSGRGRLAGLCSKICSGMKLSSFISLNDNDLGGIMECMFRKSLSVSTTDLLYEAQKPGFYYKYICLDLWKRCGKIELAL